ncbi:MAG: hypothetical protein GEU96_17665 [Propionibacteriales bacterium]|nr:hypothetical protein [Propionibacteriales bacterium]
MKRLALLPLVLAAVLVLQPVVAFAAWLAGGVGTATVSATRVSQMAAPQVVRVNGLQAQVSWEAVTLGTGDPVTSYVVRRYVGAEWTVVCQTASALSCVDTDPVMGEQTYRVAAVHGPWTGAFGPGTTFSPDTTAPVTTASANRAPNASGWITQTPVTVTLDASDGSGSGVSTITYRVDSDGWTTVNGPTATVPVTGQGIQTVHFRATDLAGNVETVLSTVLMIDSVSPDAAGGLTLGIDTGSSSTDGITNAAANHVLGTGEPGSAVRITHGTQVVGAGTVGSDGRFSIEVALVDDANPLRVQLTDAAGNESATTALDATLDTVAATAAVTYPGAGIVSNGDWNSNARGCKIMDPSFGAGICGTTSEPGAVSYEVRATNGTDRCWNGTTFSDTACGTYRAAAGAGPWLIALPSVSLPADDTIEVRIRVTDLAGNESPTSTAMQTFHTGRG